MPLALSTLSPSKKVLPSAETASRKRSEPKRPTSARVEKPVCSVSVPAPETATVEFLRFYFSTPEGLQKLGEASPGGAGRNRTLGLKKLESLQVPVPPIGRQHWFDRLQTKAHEARTIRANTAQDVEALIPAMLHEIFDGGAKAA